MNDEAPAEEAEKLSHLRLAETSLLFGFLSVFLAFVFIFGLIAIVTGRRARMRLFKSPDTRKGTTIAFFGMMLGGLSLVVGLMEISAFPIANPNHGRHGTALATAIALESAVNNIYTEYGKIPSVGNRVTTDSPAGLKLLNILLGLDNKSDDALNFRGIKFLSVKTGKNHKGGLIYTADEKTVTGLFDPWGNPYTVILDTDYDEKLDFDLGGKPIKLESRRAAIFSPGPDLKLGTSDDVKTWD